MLLILAVIWAAVLIPPIARARAEASPADSIGDFRRRLHVLQRTGPAIVNPANSLGPFVRPIGSVGPPLRRPGRPAFAGTGAPVGAPSTRFARQRRQKRRRDVFLGLLATMAGSLVLGMLPPLRSLLWIHVLADLAFLAYVGLLIHLRSLEAERDMKLRFLPSATPEPALLLRRSAN